MAVPSGSVTLFETAIKLLKDWGWGPYLTEQSGWKTRGNGHPQPQVQSSIMVHHTGGTKTSTSYLMNPTDRPHLKVLANIHITQSKIFILAAGPTSHAGNGTKSNYNKVIAGKAPLTGNMNPVRPDTTFSANRYSVGVEVNGAGGANEWSAWTKQAVLAVTTAFQIAGKWGAAPRVWAHKEFTSRKPGDPYMNMGALRTQVKGATKAGRVPVNPGDTAPTPAPAVQPKLGDRLLSKNGNDTGPDVAELAVLLKSKGYDVGTPTDVFGPKMDAAVRDFQKKSGLAMDGIVGPKTISKLKSSANPAPTKKIIIVAGSANTASGALHAKYRRRLEVAIPLLEGDPTLKIIVTGGAKAGHGKATEASRAKEYLVSKGISSSRILLEDKSGSTNSNFRYGLSIAKTAGADSLIVVSDRSHMRRCVSFAYAANKAKSASIGIDSVAWFNDSRSQDATVSQTVQQARAIWPGMTEAIVKSLDSRWGV